MEDEYPEDQAYFSGQCTCDHEPEVHGWSSCDFEGCACDAHWEE